MNEVENCFAAHYVEPADERTRYQKFIDWMFPWKHIAIPDAPDEWKDCVTSTTVCYLSLVDRLKLLVTGIMIVKTRTLTEFEVGNTATSGGSFVRAQSQIDRERA